VTEHPAAESEAKTKTCPKCASKNIELTTRRTEFTSAVGTIVLGLVLSFVFPTILVVIIPAGIYLLVSAYLAKPTYACLECRYKWKAEARQDSDRT